jgi:hypothetical protein
MASTTRYFAFGRRSLAILVVALGAGCGSAGTAPLDPTGAPKGGCACEKKICVCPHCRGPSPRCACRDMEKPQ